jgi:hypothetical protein
MGTTLTGTQIQNTYDGLIKTTDNTAITATTKLISDGLGNDTCIKVGTAGTDFLGNVDFSAATVTGLPGGAAGLVSGTGTDSMKNADSLVTNPASASGVCSVALGDGANAGGQGTVAIGLSSNAGTSFGSVAVGELSGATGIAAIGIGYLTNSGGTKSISLGYSARATAANGIALGEDACANSSGSVSIGCNACAAGFQNAVAIGPAAKSLNSESITISAAGTGSVSNCTWSVTIGNAACTSAQCAIAISRLSCVTNTADAGIAIGTSSCATAACAVALGKNVIAATANTVSVKALETQTASTPTAGGIIMTDAGSTARRLNIDASGNLQIDSTPVGGGGGAAGLESGTGTDSMQSAASLTTVAADAAASCSIAIGNGALTSGTSGGNIAIGENARSVGSNNNAGIAIGKNSCVGDYDGTAVGLNATTPTNGQVFGVGSCVSNNQGVALGFITFANGGSTALGHLAKACGSGSTAVHQACALSSFSIAIGENACVGTSSTDGIAIGNTAIATSTNTVAIGKSACSTKDKAIAIGCQARAFGPGGSVAIGFGVVCALGGDRGLGIGEDYIISGGDGISIGTTTRASACCAVAIGRDAQATACSAIALGAVTASRVNTVTGCQLEACVAGKGIVVTSPDGLTTLGIGIDNSGNIVTYTP